MNEPTNQDPVPSTTGRASASGISFQLRPDGKVAVLDYAGRYLAVIVPNTRPNRPAISISSPHPLGAYPFRDRAINANVIEVQIG